MNKLYTYRVEFDNGFTNDILVMATNIEDAERKLLAGEWESRFAVMHSSHILVFAMLDEMELDNEQTAIAA